MIQVQGKMNRKRRRSGRHRKDEEHNREKQRQEETCRQNKKKTRVKIDLPCQINHTPHKLSGKHRAALETRWGGTLPQF